jgi:hypothetical protein
MRIMRHFPRISLTALCMILAGCAALGPTTVNRDRFDYTAAIADSWKRQMLLNIVKIRYGDAPIFLDVASVINQYEVQTNLSASFGWLSLPSSNSQNVTAGGHYIDRPTITYSPMTGEKFARNLMTPVAPATVMSMVEGGYPIDLVFRILVHSVNGIQNQFGGAARTRRADPEFFPLLEKLRNIQTSGVVGLRVKKIDNHDALLMIFRKEPNKELQAESIEVRRMLGLKEDATEFKIVYGSIPTSDTEIALLTRSINEVLIDISSTVQVPDKDVTEHRVNPTVEPEGEGIKGNMISILCSEGKPGDGFAEVPYRNRWFWIDDRDYRSKRLFSFLMFVMTLTETGGKEGAPIVTISAGG